MMRLHDVSLQDIGARTPTKPKPRKSPNQAGLRTSRAPVYTLHPHDGGVSKALEGLPSAFFNANTPISY